MKWLMVVPFLMLWIPAIAEEGQMDEPKQEEIVVGPEEPNDVVTPPADAVQEEEAAPVPEVPVNPEAHTPVE